MYTRDNRNFFTTGNCEGQKFVKILKRRKKLLYQGRWFFGVFLGLREERGVKQVGTAGQIG